MHRQGQRALYVDKGPRGHGPAAREIHVKQSLGLRSPTVKRELRRRAAVEPIISRVRSDGLLERNRLAGPCGDAINAVLVGLRVLFMPVLLPHLVVEIEAQISRLFAPHAIEQNRVFAVEQATGLVPAGPPRPAAYRATASSAARFRPPWL